MEHREHIIDFNYIACIVGYIVGYTVRVDRQIYKMDYDKNSKSDTDGIWYTFKILFDNAKLEKQYWDSYLQNVREIVDVECRREKHGIGYVRVEDECKNRTDTPEQQKIAENFIFC